MTTKSDLAKSEPSPAVEAAPPPPYGDALQTPWQGTSSDPSSSSHIGISPRPPLDPDQYPLYSTSVPVNVEDPAYAERLVVGIETSVTSLGEVITHDPRLHDPAVLEAFIKQQAAIPPTLKIHCHGHHNHTSHIMDPDHNANDPVNRTRSQNDIVVDFNFEIDLTSILESTADARTLTTIRPDRATPRGTFASTFHPDFQPYGPHYRETPSFSFLHRTDATDTLDSKSRATKPGVRLVKREKRIWQRYIADRFAKGLPPWAPLPDDVAHEIQAVREQETLRSEAQYQKRTQKRSRGGDAAYTRLDQAEDGYPASRGSDLEHASLRDWCQEFCESSRPLKRFRLQKFVYGWEPGPLLVAIRAAIASTDYQGIVQVQFVQQRSLVTVHPDNLLTRWLTKKWVVFLLWVTLLYPFVWLYKRFFAGGRWIVANAYYPLKCYVPYDSTKRLSGPTSVPGNHEVRLGPNASASEQEDPSTQPFELCGYKEGRFMKRWESRIKDAVARRAGADGRVVVLGDALLVERQDAEGREAIRALDGYESA